MSFQGQKPTVYDWVEYEESCPCCQESLCLVKCKAYCPNCGFFYDCSDG